MDSGSSTITTSDRKKAFEFRDKTAYFGEWLSWTFRGEREFGKIFDHPKEAKIGRWNQEEFEWAVAEGRVPLESIELLQDHLARHEMKYIWAQPKFK